MERKIIWQKWVNPLTGAGDDELELEEKLEAEEEEEKSSYQDSVEKDLGMLAQIRMPNRFKPQMGHVIASPLGLIPVNEHGDPAVVYDFWLAHTNFRISEEVQDKGSSVPGVEAWDTFSPYRARIAFGKAFRRPEVMAEIQHVLGCTPKTKPETRPVSVSERRQQTRQRLQKQLAALAPAWAILEFADGQWQVLKGNDNEVRTSLVPYQNLPKPPTIITSWDKP